MQPRQIIFTGDALRVLDGDQTSNIDWIYHLFATKIETAFPQVPIRIIAQKHFPLASFYDSPTEAVTHSDWANLFDKAPTAEQQRVIGECYQDSLVIGFELPPLFLSALKANGIPYLNITIGPLRFCADLVLLFDTNDSSIYTALSKFNIPHPVLKDQAMRVQATVKRRPLPPMVENSCLFVAQTGVDRSQIENGRLVSLLDYIANLDEQFAKYDRVYYKHHPYQKADPKVLEFVTQHSKVEFVDYDTYSMLVNPNCAAVMALSSSVLAESVFFDKTPQALFRMPPMSTDPLPTTPENAYVSVSRSCLTFQFWQHVLSGLFGQQTAAADIEPLGFDAPHFEANVIRNTVQFYWGYGEVDFTQRQIDALRADATHYRRKSRSYLWRRSVQSQVKNFLRAPLRYFKSGND